MKGKSEKIETGVVAGKQVTRDEIDRRLMARRNYIEVGGGTPPI